MSKKPGATPAEQIASSGLNLDFLRFHCLATDPIDIDHVFAVDPEMSQKVTALRLDTQSQIHQTMAQATAQAAKLLKSGG
jgi:hypothetical protein